MPGVSLILLAVRQTLQENRRQQPLSAYSPPQPMLASSPSSPLQDLTDGRATLWNLKAETIENSMLSQEMWKTSRSNYFLHWNLRQNVKYLGFGANHFWTRTELLQADVLMSIEPSHWDKSFQNSLQTWLWSRLFGMGIRKAEEIWERSCTFSGFVQCIWSVFYEPTSSFTQ